MNIDPFISHNEIAKLLPTSFDAEDELCNWLDGTSYYWVNTDETKSFNFKKLPSEIKEAIIESVKRGDLPNRFAIYYEK